MKRDRKPLNERPITNAERQARWRARHKQELAEPKANAARVEALPASRKPTRQSQPRHRAAIMPPPVDGTRARSTWMTERVALFAEIRGSIPDLDGFKKDFSRRMKEARLAAGYSQSDVATALFGPDTPEGIYLKRYINWEHGRRPMAANVIPAFVRLVGTDCNFLLMGD